MTYSSKKINSAFSDFPLKPLPLVRSGPLLGNLSPHAMHLQNQTLDDQTESQKHDDAQTGEMEGEEEQDISQQAVVPGVGQRDGGLMGWQRRRRRRRGNLGYLTVHTCPALVALTGELVLHVQDVVVVEVAAHVEVRAAWRRVAVDVEEPRVQVQVGARVEALADAPAVLLAQRLAAQLSGRCDVDDVMSQWTVDVLLHRQTVPLEGEGQDTRCFFFLLSTVQHKFID